MRRSRVRTLRPGGHSRPSPSGPPRGIPPLPHLRTPPRSPYEPAPAGAAQRAPGGGQGGSRRRNHKAASLAGRGHSHKTDPLEVLALHSVLHGLSVTCSSCRRIVALTAGETEARSLSYQRVAGERDESPIRLPVLLLRMLPSPFWPRGLVGTQDWPAAGPPERGTQVCGT